MLSSSIKKVFYHQPEGQSVRKSFNIPLAYDAFYYLWCKLCNNSDVVVHRYERTQRCTLYFDDISMKSSSRINQIFLI
jgi:hypothetical protein